jgi:hypothetical protein
MLTCDLCKQPRADVEKRPLLRVLDQSGKRTVDTFDGKLCEHCYEEAHKFDTPEHKWVLEQISKTPKRSRR